MIRCCWTYLLAHQVVAQSSQSSKSSIYFLSSLQARLCGVAGPSAFFKSYQPQRTSRYQTDYLTFIRTFTSTKKVKIKGWFQDPSTRWYSLKVPLRFGVMNLPLQTAVQLSNPVHRKEWQYNQGVRVCTIMIQAIWICPLMLIRMTTPKIFVEIKLEVAYRHLMPKWNWRNLYTIIWHLIYESL